MFSLFSKRLPRRVIPAAKVFAILDEQLFLSPDCNVRHADRHYGLVHDEEAFKFARNVASFYIPEENDCDDFAHLFKSEAIKQARKRHETVPLACGQAWMPSHAVGIYINQDAQVRFMDYGEQVTREEFARYPFNLILL